MTFEEFYELHGERLYEKFLRGVARFPGDDIAHQRLFMAALKESYRAASNQLQERKAG